MRRWTMLACALLSGCQGTSYVLNEYGINARPVPFQNSDDTWRIFDKPSANKLMITPSLGTAAGSGFWRGASFGAMDTSIPKPMFERAAIGYLESTGRRCRIVDGYVVITPQWEFKYDCTRL